MKRVFLIPITLIFILAACTPAPITTEVTNTPTVTTVSPTKTLPPTAALTPTTTNTPIPTETTLPTLIPEPVVLFFLEQSTQEFNSPETVQAGLGDLDGDGDLDAVFANPQRNYSEVWLNDGHGMFANTDQQLTQYGHGVGIADFDSDGDLDVFIGCHQFVLPSKIYLNDGKGYFQDTGQDLGDSSLSANEINLLDLNGDGWIDVHVVFYSPEGLPDKIYLNDGTGFFVDSYLELNEETIAWGDIEL